MATIIREFTVDQPADTVWPKVADVGHVNELMDSLGEVTLEGNRRSCALGDSGRLEELIVTVDPALQRVAYAITSSPFNFAHHHASMQVFADRDRSRLLWTTDISPDELAGPVQEAIDAAVDSIKRHFA